MLTIAPRLIFSDDPHWIWHQSQIQWNRRNQSLNLVQLPPPSESDWTRYPALFCRDAVAREKQRLRYPLSTKLAVWVCTYDCTAQLQID